MSNRTIALLALLAFAVTMGIVVGNQIQSQIALTLALSIAVGVTVGLVVGGFILTRKNNDSRVDGGVTLSDEQAEALFALLENPPHPDTTETPSLPSKPRSQRDFTAVGGAQLTDD